MARRCPANKLLLFEAKDGWTPLCAFLGLPVPDEEFPYPRLNDATEFRRLSAMVNVSGYLLAGSVVAAVAAAVGVAATAYGGGGATYFKRLR